MLTWTSAETCFVCWWWWLRCFVCFQLTKEKKKKKWGNRLGGSDNILHFQGFLFPEPAFAFNNFFVGFKKRHHTHMLNPWLEENLICKILQIFWFSLDDLAAKAFSAATHIWSIKHCKTALTSQIQIFWQWVHNMWPERGGSNVTVMIEWLLQLWLKLLSWLARNFSL